MSEDFAIKELDQQFEARTITSGPSAPADWLGYLALPAEDVTYSKIFGTWNAFEQAVMHHLWQRSEDFWLPPKLQWRALQFSAKDMEVALEKLISSDLLKPVGDKFDDDRLAFALPGKFAPSDELTQFWVRGVSAFAEKANIKLLAISKLELQQEFSKELSSLIGLAAQQIRYGEASDLSITKSGRFEIEYQVQICDRFMIIPDESTEFLDLLRHELIEALADGCSIAGAWGRVRLTTDRELGFELTPPNIITDPSFVPSEEVE